MCRYMAKLAEISYSRYIMCCEHGSIHVQWEKVRFTFTYAEFVHLISVLEAKQFDVPAHVRDVQEWDAWLDNQQYRVNVGPVSLTLTTDELTSLVQGAYAALTRLGENSNPADYALHIHRQHMAVPPTDRKCIFSAN